MIDPKVLERLHNSRDFLAFLEEINENREALIRSLYGNSNEQIQQKAGCITALTDMLDEAEFEKLRATWRRVEQ
jgi:hypothetical protein